MVCDFDLHTVIDTKIFVKNQKITEFYYFVWMLLARFLLGILVAIATTVGDGVISNG